MVADECENEVNKDAEGKTSRLLLLHSFDWTQPYLSSKSSSRQL